MHRVAFRKAEGMAALRMSRLCDCAESPCNVSTAVRTCTAYTWDLSYRTEAFNHTATPSVSEYSYNSQFCFKSGNNHVFSLRLHEGCVTFFKTVLHQSEVRMADDALNRRTVKIDNLDTNLLLNT